MPSHPKNKRIKDSEQKQSPGGPLKRTGSSAEEWDMVIGPSLDNIPTSQLPLVRTILQRYRALRIEYHQENTSLLAKKIAIEVELIWKKARVPTKHHKNCVRAVCEVINSWKACHNPGELERSLLNEKLDSLLDLAPKLKGNVNEEAHLENLKYLMKKNYEFKMKSETDKYHWETDYDFYVDQLKVSLTLGQVEKNCSSAMLFTKRNQLTYRLEVLNLKSYNQVRGSTPRNLPHVDGFAEGDSPPFLSKSIP